MKIRTVVMSGLIALSMGAIVPATAFATSTSPLDRGAYQERRDGREFAAAAFRNGQRDGMEKGREDARHHRSPDVNRQKWFRSGDHDYNGRFGPRDAYRSEYRRGFEEGYRRAYEERRR